MKLSVLKGIIRRRMLVNFRVKPDIIQNLLPEPFRPKLHRGFAVAGICLIRLEQVRPDGFPAWMGFASENAAHRIAVEWTSPSNEIHEGVFIHRRDSDSWISHLGGGRLFPGEHHRAQFDVRDKGNRIEFSMAACDQTTCVHVCGNEGEVLPASSCFASLGESSRFFEGGSLGFSATCDSHRLEGMRLKTLEWRVKALYIERVESSFFSDTARFPQGSVEFDHALIMRNIPHEWHRVAGTPGRDGE